MSIKSVDIVFFFTTNYHLEIENLIVVKKNDFIKESAMIAFLLSILLRLLKFVNVRFS